MYKIRIQKSVAFPHVTNEVTEIEIKETISSRNKVPSNYDLYLENYKMMMEEFENDTKKWSDVSLDCKN